VAALSSFTSAVAVISHRRYLRLRPPSDDDDKDSSALGRCPYLFPPSLPCAYRNEWMER
jgi:hypothetical protein